MRVQLVVDGEAWQIELPASLPIEGDALVRVARHVHGRVLAFAKCLQPNVIDGEGGGRLDGLPFCAHPADTRAGVVHYIEMVNGPTAIRRTVAVGGA